MDKILSVPTLLNGMLGKICCRQRIGEWKSIHLGFGEKVYHHKNTLDGFYGEWEVGTYSSNWEIYHNDSLLLTSKSDHNESNNDLDIRLQKIFFDRLKEIELLNDNLTVKLSFNNDIFIFFYEMPNEDDTEIIHFFIPHNYYVEFHPKDGWKVEKASK